MSYDEAVAALYQAPVASFVAERKRLAGELRDAGDKAGAAKLGKLGKPTLSAWVVNQLYWHARDAFDQMMETANRLRAGDLGASAAHREAIANLRARAARILTDGGHGAPEATLRRVTTTLSALAAAGGFDPDPPGALAEDRDPVGFDVAVALAHVPVRHAPTVKPAPVEEPPQDELPAEDEAERRAELQRKLDDEAQARAKKAEEAKHEAERKHHDEAEAKRREEAEAKRRAEDARAKKAAERSKLVAGLATARAELANRERAVTALSEQLEAAEQKVAEVRELIAMFEAKLAELGN